MKYWLGKKRGKLSEEIKKKISDSMKGGNNTSWKKGQNKGKENINWKGGKELSRKRSNEKLKKIQKERLVKIAGRAKPDLCEICGAMVYVSTMTTKLENLEDGYVIVVIFLLD